MIFDLKFFIDVMKKKKMIYNLKFGVDVKEKKKEEEKWCKSEDFVK